MRRLVSSALTLIMLLGSCTPATPEPAATPSPTITPTPVLTPTPTPTPTATSTPTTSDDKWGLWGPSSFPEDFKVTRGAHLDFVKKEEVTVSGKPAIIYYLVADGLPKDKVYYLWMKSLSNPTPTQLSLEMRIHDSGYVTDEKGRFQLGMQALVKGEAMEFALMTADKATGVAGKVIPYPIESKQGPYRLWVELRSKKGDIFTIRGEGFEPNEEIEMTSTSDGEVAKGKVKADSRGRTYTVVLPAVVGKESGLATYALLGKSGEVKVSYAWGAEATKTVPSSPTPTPSPTP